MIRCQNCHAAAQLFLCPRCQADLRTMLADLPWWIDRLAEAAVGQAKLGDGGRHNGKGADLVKYTDEQPAVDDEGFNAGMTRGQQRLERDIASGKFGLSAVLAAGGVNARASRLLDRVQNSLTTIVRDLCETRGIPVRNVRAVAPSFIGPLLPNDIRVIYRSDAQFAAAWLSERVTTISADESAGQWFGEIRGYLGDDRQDGEIAKVLNRPVPTRFLGKCPTWDETKRAACGTELRCRQGVIEVFCRVCRQTHNADRLQLLMINDLEREKLTIKRILELNRILPEEYRINERTLRRWRQEGPHGEPPKLKPRGYLRSNGHRVINRHSDDDEPLFLWADVRKLRAGMSEAKAG